MKEALKEIAAGLTKISEAVQSLIEQPKLEEVRAVLAEISRSGRTSEMKELLAKFGATKLSDVPSERYPELLAAAKELSNA